MWEGGKDILVCVHIRNILRARVCYRNVKVPSSPYKRGREGTCKRIQTFLGLVLLAESFTVSLRPNLVPERVENSTRVWAVIRIFRVSPNNMYKRKAPSLTFTCSRFASLRRASVSAQVGHSARSCFWQCRRASLSAMASRTHGMIHGGRPRPCTGCTTSG
jgi:hypothetical protein